MCNALGLVLGTREKVHYAFSTNTVWRNWDLKKKKTGGLENGNKFHGVKQYIISSIIHGTLQVIFINPDEMIGNVFYRK